MADLTNNLSSLNKWKRKHNEPELTEDDLLIKLFDEVEYAWPKLGYPPLVTPFSQYVKNVALMNVLQVEKGGERWSMIADNIWDMVLGKSGQLPGKVGDEILALAKKEGHEFFTGHPQDLYPDELDTFRKEMDEKGWAYGEDDEELMELAMHPAQYRDYKSGQAKADFKAEIAEIKENEASGERAPTDKKAAVAPLGATPSTMNIDVNGEKFVVSVSYDENDPSPTAPASANQAPQAPASSNGSGSGEPVISPLEGKFYFTKDSGDKAIQVGDKVKAGDLVGYVEAMKTYNAVKFDQSGTIQKIAITNGADVDEDDVLVILG
ncbi:biotin/lipoyl-containing protein [Geofilum rubicundum]|nr:biotin/lipoyl-containing protein [Geofilum rubicundum]